MSFRRQLAQVRPSGTSAQSLFSPTNNDPYEVDLITVTNVAGVPITVSLFHDVDGTTYDQSTALIYQEVIQSPGFIEWEFERGLADYQKAGNVGIQVDIANGATFTAYGRVMREQL